MQIIPADKSKWLYGRGKKLSQSTAAPRTEPYYTLHKRGRSDLRFEYYINLLDDNRPEIRFSH